MRRHPVITTIVILMLVALLLGITAGDAWHYIIDFCKTGVTLFIDWMDEMIRAIKESLLSAANV